MDFFADLLRLRERSPHPAILSIRSENCAFCPYHAAGKGCYWIVGHVESEDCYYGFWLGVSRDCVDCAFTEKSELCYECVDVQSCYNLSFSRDCITCSDCDFCYDCKGCQNCFGCVNLRNKQYHIFNKPYSKEEYFQKVAILKKQYSRLDNPPPEFVELCNTMPRIAMQGFNNDYCVGDHIFNSKNAFFCFDVSEQEDTAYIYNSHHIKDSMDCNYTSLGSEMNYMCHSAVTLYGSNYCNICWYSQNLEYCEYVFNSHDCLGCISRNRAEYEILNRKYPKEEYFKKRAEIIDQLKHDGTYGTWWWPALYPEIQPFSSFMA